jgi:hypothetical protein
VTHIHCLGRAGLLGVGLATNTAVACEFAIQRPEAVAGPDADGIRRKMSAFAEHSLYLRGFDAFQGGVLHNARTQRP